MTSIHLILTGAQATAEVTGVLTERMAGIPVHIQWNNEWEGLTKTLVCKNDAGTVSVVDLGEETTLPQEALTLSKHKFDQNELYIGVEGRSADGEIVLPSTMAFCGKISPGANPADDKLVRTAEQVWERVLQTVRGLDHTEQRWKNDLATIITEVVKQEQITGGYYTPEMEQTDDATVLLRFIPSRDTMPSLPSVTITAPAGAKGEKGDPYTLTPEDQAVIVAAVLAALPDGDGVSYG